MFIKVHDNGFTKYLINTSHITYIANDGRKTSIGLDDKTFLCVSETPDEIMEVLKAEDPLREKILEQSDKIDNMLDNMEKDKSQYYDLLSSLPARVLNWSYGEEDDNENKN